MADFTDFERVKEAFSLTKDVVTQVLTLSTALIGVSATFAEKFAPNASHRSRLLLYFSWFFHLLACAFGVWTLMSLAGTMAAGEGLTSKATYDANIARPAALQILTFLVGLLLLLIQAGMKKG